MKLVIIPTYNEAENIINLIRKINSLGVSDLDVLVIDDNSPDNTSGVVKNLQERYRNLFLKKRPKKLGLASAYREGFVFALGKGYQAVAQMDADFSHSPEKLESLFQTLEKKDLAVGSRYIRGGEIENWGFFRKTISYFANLYSRVILKAPIKDLTGGFNAWRAGLLQEIPLEKINSIGYVFQVELKYWALKKGCSFQEIPIVFKERREGNSKFKIGIIIEAFYKIVKLRYKNEKD